LSYIFFIGFNGGEAAILGEGDAAGLVTAMAPGFVTGVPP
jgi:hypothetical protein